MITCIPYAIQTDGSHVASWRDLLAGDPDVGTQSQQIHYVQLNYVLYSSSMVRFSQIRSKKSNTSRAMDGARCAHV